MQLSKRLQAVGGLAGEAEVLADVGTDHGYIPLSLVSCGKVKRAIAMDVNQGPLLRAEEHIRQFHMEERIETRISDGLCALHPKEADVIVIAGMGGALMTRILTQGEDVARQAERLVLQPQSEIYNFRCFLADHGYQLIQEDMVYEDGKFYTMMAVKWRGSGVGSLRQQFEPEASLKYGPLLLAKRHPVLRQYLLLQKGRKQKILDRLQKEARFHASEREAQITEELAQIEGILNIWKEEFNDLP